MEDDGPHFRDYNTTVIAIEPRSGSRPRENSDRSATVTKQLSTIARVERGEAELWLVVRFRVGCVRLHHAAAVGADDLGGEVDDAGGAAPPAQGRRGGWSGVVSSHAGPRPVVVAAGQPTPAERRRSVTGKLAQLVPVGASVSGWT